jgi:hypothetical protein
MCKFEMGPKRGKNIKLKCKEMRGGGEEGANKHNNEY